MNIKSLTPHQAVQVYLMCSYQYYHRFTSLIEDAEYDYLAKYLLEHFDKWQDHQHNYLITKDDLKAGTMYALKRGDYPEMIIQASEMWSREKIYEEVVLK